MCPSSGDLCFVPDVVSVDRDVIYIPIWDSFIVNSRALPFFHLWQIRNHTHFSGARSPHVT
jgi:hypothetical protein